MQPQHGEGEIAAHRTHHPAGAQHRGLSVVTEHGFDRFLAAGLAGAVDPQRVTRLLHPVGAALAAVEHEVGAQLQQPPPLLPDRFGKGAGSPSIHGMRQVRLLLGPVHGGVSAGIQHPVGTMAFHRRHAGFRLAQIQLVPTGGDQLQVRWAAGAQGLPQLAGGSGEQHFHRNRAPFSRFCRRPAAPASFSDRLTLTPSRRSSGQAMARSGSSQRIARSQSRFQKPRALY